MSQDRTNPSDEPTSTFQPGADAPSSDTPSYVKPSLDKAQAPAEPTQSVDPGPYGRQPDHGQPSGPPAGQSYGQGPDQQYGQQPYTEQPYTAQPYTAQPYGQPAHDQQGGYGPQQYPPTAYGQQAAYGGGYAQPYPPTGPPTNTLAIIALIASFLVAPLGIILGIIARNQIKRTGEGGDGLALAGLIIGIVITALYVAMFVFVFVVVANTIPTVSSDYPFPTN